MKMLSVFLMCLAICLASKCSVYAEDGAMQNIALGCPATFDPPPNDGGCTDPDDSRQLTDGKFAGEGFWIDKQCVGWVSRSPVYIIIDLGSIKPISGLMFSTAARANADVLWPMSIMVMVSDDGINNHYICDLVAKDRLNGVPPTPADVDIRHQFKTADLRTHGRYICLSVISKCPYIFTDEIEVYAGDESYLNEKLPGEPTLDIHHFARVSAHKMAVAERVSIDIASIKTKIKDTKLAEATKKSLLDELGELGKRIEDLPAAPPPGFKTILPINDLEASVMAVNGSLLQEMGLQPITVWKKHKYDRLELFEQPNNNKPVVSIDALRNEFRSDSFFITNASNKPTVCNLKISGVPGAPKPGWLEVSSVPWTDTTGRVPVASALPPARFINGGYEIIIPAGMTRVVWFTADTSSIKPGKYKGALLLNTGVNNQKIPIQVQVSKIAMSKPRLHLGMWDHTNGNSNRGLGPGNIPAAIKMMRSHFTDTPWTETDGLPIEENLTPASFSTFDQWIKRWPDARHYMVFMNVKAEFQGAKMGTPEFESKVGNWAKAVEDHVKSLNMNPKKLSLLLIDEPRSDAQDEIIVAWIKAIRAAGVKITFFQDPIWENPEKNKIQEAITLPEIVCPNLMIYFRGGPEAQRYYEGIKKSGNSLWFYLCSGPVRTVDPTDYYRLTAWHAFKAGAEGIGFWAFGDLGGGTSSWNEYSIPGNAYAPAFVDPEGVTDSIHWQSVREGVEDYEYLSMLRDAAEKCTNPKFKSEALKLISDVVNNMTENQKPEYTWKSDIMHAKVDESRIRVLRMLEKISK
jgi:hypothetical protein